MEMLSLSRESQPTLRYAVFEPDARALSNVLLTPGFSEHIGRYEHVAEAWRGEGHRVAVYDPRGQGDSEGQSDDSGRDPARAWARSPTKMTIRWVSSGSVEAFRIGST